MLRAVEPLEVEVDERALNALECFDFNLQRLADVVRDAQRRRGVEYNVDLRPHSDAAVPSPNRIDLDHTRIVIVPAVASGAPAPVTECVAEKVAR